MDIRHIKIRFTYSPIVDGKQTRLPDFDETGTIGETGNLTIYDFEYRDDAVGTQHGVDLLRQWFPDMYQTKGMGVYETPIGKVVVTFRSIVLLSKRTRKAIEWMESKNLDLQPEPWLEIVSKDLAAREN